MFLRKTKVGEKNTSKKKKNRDEIMWKDMVETGRLQMTV
jgi:hypothetical protein